MGNSACQPSEMTLEEMRIYLSHERRNFSTKMRSKREFMRSKRELMRNDDYEMGITLEEMRKYLSNDRRKFSNTSPPERELSATQVAHRSNLTLDDMKSLLGHKTSEARKRRIR